MCILLKLHYAKFGVSMFCLKVIEEKPLGGGRLDPPPPLVKERLMFLIVISSNSPCYEGSLGCK